MENTVTSNNMPKCSVNNYLVKNTAYMAEGTAIVSTLILKLTKTQRLLLNGVYIYVRAEQTKMASFFLFFPPAFI